MGGTENRHMGYYKLPAKNKKYLCKAKVLDSDNVIISC